MKIKTVSLLLVCLVALSILYAYGSATLAPHATQPLGTAPSTLLTMTEETLRNANLPPAQLVPLGDPIDDPIPHDH